MKIKMYSEKKQQWFTGGEEITYTKNTFVKVYIKYIYIVLGI